MTDGLAGFDELLFAKVDSHRQARQGLPEVVFCQGKTPEQIARILERLHAAHGVAFGTRADAACADAVQALLSPDIPLTYDAPSRTLLAGTPPPLVSQRHVVSVLSAGTSDIPVAAEAVQTLQAFGIAARPYYDCGVAGIHRLLAHLDVLRQAAVVIVVAGMEGALTSVVGGLVACPVIAVPTSVGYGSHLGGWVPLMGMLNSCSPNVTVVNIDNGFGAAFSAATIIKALAACDTANGGVSPEVSCPSDENLLKY